MISKKNTEKSTEEFKFENYMDFELSVRFVKPHQVSTYLVFMYQHLFVVFVFFYKP